MSLVPYVEEPSGDTVAAFLQTTLVFSLLAASRVINIAVGAQKYFSTEIDILSAV